MGQPCPQMEFFRREYNLNHKIHTLMWAEPSKTHVSSLSPWFVCMHASDWPAAFFSSG